MTDTAAPIARALLSVSDKTGLVDFAQALAARGIEILSTGGTARTLQEAGLAVRDVAEVTGFPEMMDGRVKTLHPHIHGGILARRNVAGDLEAMTRHAIGAIDLVAVNLYPFEETLAAGADAATIVENIDIGGPALIRAAAKNHDSVTIVVDTEDYAAVLEDMAAHDGATSLALRIALAGKAYRRTAAYDAAIGAYFAHQQDEPFPERLPLAASRAARLRYGENPHQAAALYTTGETRPGVANARQIQGKALSFNNLNDTNAAFELVAEFDPAASAAVAIIKHANPCGVALGASLREAYEKALRCDPVSAFGGIVALNRPLDAPAAEAITEIFTEVIIAPDATAEAIEIAARKKNLRLLLTGGLPDPAAPGMDIRTLAGGLLVQTRDALTADPDALTVVTKRAPDARERADLLFAFTVAKHVKSNTIVYARDGATMGIGAGQMSRVDAARIAAHKAREAAAAAGLDTPLTQGSVAASDAFFPFADGLEAVAEAGATAVIQPGGSVRDAEVIAAADKAGLAMMLTGLRHFRH